MNTDLWARRIAYILSRLVYWFSRHWLLVANVAIGIYLALPFIAPVLMHLGYDRPANLIYVVFSPLCHQLPERSFFLFGPRWVYSYEELAEFLGGDVPTRYIGATALGFKTAVCQRDVAIYLGMLLMGVLFVGVRSRLRPLPLRSFAVLIVPMAVDGFGQLFGLWTSTWWSRLLTGGLFGVACVWLAYPYLESGMREVHQQMGSMLHEGDQGWKPKS